MRLDICKVILKRPKVSIAKGETWRYLFAQAHSKKYLMGK